MHPLIYGIFLQETRHEWFLSEFKLNGHVFSIIISNNDNMQVNVYFPSTSTGDLVYWITVHSHPRGGGIGLSNNPDDPERSDYATVDLIRYGKGYEYESAQFNAYDLSNLHYARGFIELNRK